MNGLIRFKRVDENPISLGLAVGSPCPETDGARKNRTRNKVNVL